MTDDELRAMVYIARRYLMYAVINFVIAVVIWCVAIYYLIKGNVAMNLSLLAVAFIAHLASRRYDKKLGCILHMIKNSR